MGAHTWVLCTRGMRVRQHLVLVPGKSDCTERVVSANEKTAAWCAQLHEGELLVSGAPHPKWLTRLDARPCVCKWMSAVELWVRHFRK